jgi:hypothetical protein
MESKSPLGGTNSKLETSLFNSSESERKSQLIVYLETSKIEEIDEISELSGLSRSSVARKIIEQGLEEVQHNE